MKAKKSLGQNFLIDNNIIDKICDCINAKENDLIVEIGPGMGALTKKLREKKCMLICYEIDEDMHKYLDKYVDSYTKIIFKDILLSDVLEDIKDIKYNRLYVVGNLPYYITTPIIKRLITLNLNASEMIFMVQDEVADRFTAHCKSKEYGSITLYLKYYFDVEKLFKVSKKYFNPVPKVESAIIKFTKRKDKLDVLEESYFKLINDAFRMKRKNIKNNLINYDLDIVKSVLNKYGYDLSSRAEELPEEVFIELCNELSKKNH